MRFNEENEFNLKEAIIKVIAFFDLFDYILTDLEIWRYLGVKRELFEVIEALADMMQKPPLPPLIKGGNGFYFLAGREKNIITRLSRYNFTDRKFKRALLVSKIFKFIPWIKMIALGNLIGAHNLKDDSDLDFFIVAEDKRIWLTRFFCVGIIKLLGWRPQANNSRDKICLSFYVSEKAMNLRGLMIKSPLPLPVQAGRQAPLLKGVDNVDDIYFIYWLAGLTPLYDRGGVYEKFMAANSWLKNYLPNWRPQIHLGRRDVGSGPSQFYRDIIDLFFGGLEPWFKKLQLKILPENLKNLMNQDSRVAVNNQIIKLHANDRREEYREKFFEKINNLSLRA